MIVLDDEALEDIISRERVTIVQYGLETCAPCHDIRRKLEAYESMICGVQYVYVDIATHLTLASGEGIFSAPTVCVYVEGSLTVRESGYFSLDILLSRVDRYLELMKSDK